jgi:hypothetical protein
MATAYRPHTVAGHPAFHPRQREQHPGGTWRTALLTTIAVFVGAVVISVLMALSILLTTPAPGWDVAPMAQPVPHPSAESGLDL